MLDELVADGFDEEGIGELPSLDDLRKRRRGDDRVVVTAGDRFVEAFLDEHTRGDDVEDETARVADRRHRRAALRADAQFVGDAVEHRHARQVRGERAAPGMVTSPLLLVALGVVTRGRGLVLHGAGDG